MRKIVFIFIWLLLPNLLQGRPLSVKIETPYAVVIDVDTGEIIYEKRAHEEVFPASTTKVAMLLTALKIGIKDENQVVVASPEALKKVSEAMKKSHDYELPSYWLEYDGTMIYLKPGERMSLKDLMYGAMLSSANDAANVIGEYLMGNIANFVSKMNEVAKECGCQHTHFRNPHGLHHPEHKTTAYDMALITREALKYPMFREIFGTNYHLRPVTNLQSGGEFIQTTALVRKESDYYYPWVYGCKTGKTKAAKFNLIAAASNGERNIILVLHKSPSVKQRYLDAITLMETVFGEIKEERKLFCSEDQEFTKKIKGGTKPITGVLKDDVLINYYPSLDNEFSSKLIWNDISLPVKKGDIVGKLAIYRGKERMILEVPLFAKEDIGKKHHIWFWAIIVSLILGLSLYKMIYTLSRK